MTRLFDEPAAVADELGTRPEQETV